MSNCTLYSSNYWRLCLLFFKIEAVLSLIAAATETDTHQIINTASEWSSIHLRSGAAVKKKRIPREENVARQILDDTFWDVTFPDTQSRCDQINANVIGNATPASTGDNRRSIAEYEPMQGANVACIYKDSLGNEWGGFGVPLSLLKEIAMDSILYVLVSPAGDANARNFCANLLLETVDPSNVVYIEKTLDSWWTRDYGAFWVTNPHDGAFIVDHIYNRLTKVEWDFGGCRVNDNAVPEAMAQQLGVPFERSGVVLTGGNHMVNGKGAGMSVDKVFDDNMQGTQTKSGIQPFHDWADDAVEGNIRKAMKDYYGIEHFYTPSDPQDTYIDHVDTWGKWVQDTDGNEILVLGKYPEGDKNHKAMENLVVDVTNMINETTGKAPTIKRITLAMNDSEGTVYGFYMNCLIFNKKLFVPIIAGANGKKVRPNSVADILNKQALAQWESILGEDFTVIGYTHNVPEIGAAHDAYPPEKDPSTWNIWFTWDALHCRVKGVPDLKSFVPKAAKSSTKSAKEGSGKKRSGKGGSGKGGYVRSAKAGSGRR